jgi:hypothetical protein
MSSCSRPDLPPPSLRPVKAGRLWQTRTVRSVTRTVRGLLKHRFGSALRFTQLTNLTLLTLAALPGDFLQPAALARRLQTQTTFRYIEKRAHRFAGNLRLRCRQKRDHNRDHRWRGRH